MSLTHAITQTMQAHDLTTAEVAKRWKPTQTRATLHYMLNGATQEPHLNTLLQLCVVLEISPSELLELAEVWVPDTPGRMGPDILRLRHAFGHIGTLPPDGKQWAVSLVTALATALVDKNEPIADDGLERGPAPLDER
jgi:DNA-binding Xre family transcriptional regulator